MRHMVAYIGRWQWLAALLVVTAFSCAEPPTPTTAPTTAPLTEPIAAPASAPTLAPPPTPAVAITPATAPTPVEAPTPAVIKPVPMPPTPPADAPARAAELRGDAVTDALLGEFDVALDKLRRAAALAPNDSKTAMSVELLKTYVARRHEAETQRAAEYVQAVRRVKRAMMAQAHLTDDSDQKHLETLREAVGQLAKTYEGLTSPRALREAGADEAKQMRADSLEALDKAQAKLGEIKGLLLAGGDGEYRREFVEVVDALLAELSRYRQAWADANFASPDDHETSVRGIQRVESDLAYAISDVEVMVSERPWRMALVHAALARKVASEADRITEQPWYRQLLADSVERGQALIDEAEWTMALVAYMGLEAMVDGNGEYKRTAKLVRRHVRVLGLYGPPETAPSGADAPIDEFWQDDEFWRDVVQGITEQMVRTIISRVDSYYVTTIDYRKLIHGALTSVLVLAETPQITGTFEGLADDSKREAFGRAIHNAIDHFAAKPDPLDYLELLLALKTVLDASDATVDLPIGVLGMEFADGFLDELDDFSQPIWPKEVSQFNKVTKGAFVGVGIQVHKDLGEPMKVVTPIAGTPAFRAGIQTGDLIVAVNGVPTKDLPIDHIIQMIVGDKGTTVVLRIRRRGIVAPMDVELVRDTIKIRSIKGWRLGPTGEWDFMVDPAHKIGYIRLARFTEETASDLTRALKALQGQGATSVILDMRLNPGGLLRAATRTTNEFVDGGKIVMTRGRHVPKVEYKANWRGQFVRGRLVVLIDEYSASASEIVSGALQDMGRAKIIGQRSYGKGSVQQVLPIALPPNEAQALLRLTAAYYYVGPSEHLLHRTSGAAVWGVQPDVVIRMTPRQIRRWLEIRQQTDLLHEIAPDRLEADLAEQYEADLQLITAVTLLKLEYLHTAPEEQAAAE
ncbi:MAG TPA: S41 family peptidase [Phycisphaerae bacterium]|nr:S41 family peptidase [Phycisphaerae bacterium]HDZ44218.1 S41 family peptidase [Phycisphaerae bacterium]